MSDKKSQNDNGKNIRKRFMKLIVRAGIGFLLLILLILFFLTLPPGETLIRKIAQNQISNILQRPVKIADFSTNLISSIELTGLHIPVEDEDPENTLLGIGRISISYNLWALLHKNIRLKSVDISGIDLFLQRNEDGTLNLPGIMTANGDTAAKDTPAGGFTFTLEQASVSNSNLHYEDIPASVKISLKTLSLKLRQEQPGHYAIEMSVDSGGTRYREKYFALRKFLADGKVTPEMYQLDTLRLDLTDIILSGDASLSRSPSDAAIDGRINYTINTTAVSDLFRDQIPERIYPVRSHINGRIWLSRTLENPAVETTLEVEGAQLGPDLPFAATAHLVWQKDSLMIRNLAMGIFRGTIIAKGAIKLDTLYQHALNLYLNQVALEELYDYIYAEKSPFQGNIQGSIYSNGPLADLFNINTEVDFTVKKFNYKSRSFPDFNLEMNFRNHRALLKAEQGQSNIRADLNISEEYLSGSYSAEIGHVQPYLALAQIPGVTGSINLDGNISGTLDSPDISMAFSGKNISYRNFPLNRIDGNLDFQKNQLSVRNTTFSGEIGNIDTLKPPFDLPDISGSFSYEGFLEGSPENPRGEVLLSANNFSYRNYQIDRVNVHVKIDSHQVSVSPGHIIRDSLLLSLGGRYDLQELQGEFFLGLVETNSSSEIQNLPAQSDPEEMLNQYGFISSRFNFSDSSNWKIEMTGREVSVQKISELLPQQQPVSGSLDFSGNFQGNLFHPRIELSFMLATLQYNEARLDSAGGVFAIRNNFAILDSLKIYLYGEMSKISGEVELESDSSQIFTVNRNSRISIQANGEHLNLQFLEPLMQEHMKMKGFLDYSLHVRGIVGNPDIEGEIRISEGSFVLNPDVPGLADISLRMNFSDSLFTLQELKGRYRQTPFLLAGNFITTNWRRFKPDFTLRIENSEAMNLKGEISQETFQLQLEIRNFQIEPLQTFIPDITGLNGELYSDLVLSGSYNNPEITGELRLANFKLQPAMLQEKIHNGKIRLSLNGNAVVIDTFQAQLDDGRINLSGSFQHHDLKLTALDVRTTMESVSIAQQDFFILLVESANLKYHKTENFYLLEGNIILGKSEIVRNIEPRDIIQSFETVEQPAAQPPELFRNTKINVQLRESEKIWIDNNLAKLRLHTEMTFIGTLARPNITGRLNVEEGYVMYLDRKFQVETGVLDFINPTELNPVINLKTVSTVKVYELQEPTEYKVTLAVSGPMDQPVVELTSNPPLDRSSILSLLTLGTPMENIAFTGEEEGPSVANVLRSRAASLSSRKITGLVSRQVGNLLGLDQVRIEGNIFRFKETGGPQLVASKTFLDNFEVTYSTSVGHLNEQSIRLDYHISKYWSIQGQTDQRGESGIDLKYRLKFR